MSTQVISTISDKCRRCYSCIKECPAKAIRVLNGQAVILEERCITCGHCVKVCSQHAKKINSDIDNVLFNFIPTGKAVAIIAPAFAASFPDNYWKVPTALRKIGFSKVTETAFGADLVSKEYAEIVENNPGKTVISSPCPAVYNFIEKYYYELVPNLAQVVSPMVAMGRYIKKNIGEDYKVIFIGPCTAKKSEYVDEEVEHAVDGVLTFIELKHIFDKLKINLNELEDSFFDPPHPNLGKTFPLAGGLLKTANISNDLLQKDIIVVDGKEKVIQIIEDIANGRVKNKLVDILFCEGCISGPAIDSEENYYSRHEKMIEYIHESGQYLDKNVWKGELYNNRDINLKRSFHNKPQRKPMPSEDRIRAILANTQKYTKNDELNCGACGYATCREYAIAIAKGLAEEEMCLPFLITKLERAYVDLKDTQEQLHSAEKLASIGQLAAGVAHEINNPLGTIILYASMLRREMEKKLSEGEQTIEDLKLIVDEANRCKNIVANLLNFARQGKLKISRIDINNLIDEIVHSIKINPANTAIFINVVNNLTTCEIDGDKDQLKQVFLNIINNACEAVEESQIKSVTINLHEENEYINVDVIDTGAGIPAENMGKLFTPFFTTKKIGKGTGLGLPISYGIIKMHRGRIDVKSKEQNGSIFSIKLPKILNIKSEILYQGDA